MCSREKAAIDDLLKIKLAIEKNIEDLSKEASNLKERLANLREERSLIQHNKIAKYEDFYRIKMSLVDIEGQLEGYSAYLKLMFQKQRSIEESMQDVMKLSKYESEVQKKVSIFEKMMSFYGEDSLQMDLMKKTNEVREKRVIYTELDKEYNSLIQLIQEERRKKELSRQAELEKKRQEEETLREERRIKELALTRQELFQQRSVNSSNTQQVPPFQPQQNAQKPFLIPRVPNGSFKMSGEVSSSSHDSVYQSSEGRDGFEILNGKTREELDNRTTFSQMLRW